VGARIQLRRVILGMSQTRLAEKLGLTFQQVQKYEHGVNRVSASRLFELAQALDVPIGFFFDDLPGNEIFSGQFNCGPVMQRASGDVTGQPETQDLLRAYYAISDATIRRRILELVKCLAAGDGQLESSRDDARPDNPVGGLVARPIRAEIAL
jgi:transcriptional regulator with XRE-family HTH domain